MIVLGQVGWVVFINKEWYFATSGVISAVAVGTITLWFVHTERKWGDFLKAGNARLFDPNSGGK